MEALVRASAKLRQEGYGLIVFDGYRPWSVTKLFWDETPPAKRQFVADPKKGSKHNRGCSVDLTLYDLQAGGAVTMPSGYDEFSERAYPDYQGGSDESRRLRDLLRKVMDSEGFTVYEYEWWHFDYKDWAQYPVLDIPFSKIGAARWEGLLQPQTKSVRVTRISCNRLLGVSAVRFELDSFPRPLRA